MEGKGQPHVHRVAPWSRAGAAGAGAIASPACHDDSVPVPKNNATSGFPTRKQKEQLMCKYTALKGKNRAVLFVNHAELFLAPTRLAGSWG